MATTKIWAVKDSLSRVVNYAENPNKTVIDNLEQVLKYAENDEKTINGNEKMMYVTGVNCNRDTAYIEMQETQKRFNKTTGNIAYHAYQSFKTGEVSPELAHKIGVELAQTMFPEQQVLVATHFNTGTYHNHLIISSVNMFTGKKFNCNIGAYYRFREISDNLCAKYGLTVIEKPKGKTPRNIYFAEKNGEPTKYNLMRQAINEAIEMSISYNQFKKIMLKKGYIINDDSNRKYATIRSINDKKAVRMYHLGEEYLPKNIADKVFTNPYYVQDKYYDYIEKQKRYKNRNYKIYKFKENINNIKRIKGLDALFLLLFHFLGIIPKKENYKPLSPEMKREVRKMERYSNEINLIFNENLKTVDDVNNFILLAEEKIEELTIIRQKNRNKLRNCTNEELINKYKLERNDYTQKIQEQRKKIKIAYYILKDIPKVKRAINIEKFTRNQEINNQKMKSNRKKERYCYE